MLTKAKLLFMLIPVFTLMSLTCVTKAAEAEKTGETSNELSGYGTIPPDVREPGFSLYAAGDVAVSHNLNIDDIISVAKSLPNTAFSNNQTRYDQTPVFTASGSDPLSATDIIMAGKSLGTVAAGAVSDKSVAMSEGAKDLYVVVKDSIGNPSNVLKIEVPAYNANLIGDYRTVIRGSQDSSVKYNGVSTYIIDFQVQTLNGKTLANAQSLKLSIDLSVLNLLRWNGTAIDLSSLTTEFQSLPVNACSTENGWSGKLMAAKSPDGRWLQLAFEPSRETDPFTNPNGYTYDMLTALESVRFSFLPGKSANDVSESVIRLMTAGELLITNQSEQLLLCDGTYSYAYGTQANGSFTPAKDTLSAPEFNFMTGFSINGRIKSYNPKNVTSIKLLQDGLVKYETSIPGVQQNGQLEQDFTIDGVAPGAYTIEVTKDAHTKYTVKSVVVNGDVDLTKDTRPGAQLMTLLCGDVNSDGVINVNDLNILWSSLNYGKSVDTAQNPLCDLDGNGVINVNDLNILWSSINYGKGAVVIN